MISLNRTQSNFVAKFGIYGAWLIKYGKHLPEGEATDEIKSAYRAYLNHFGEPVAHNELNLFAAIDNFCYVTHWERPFSSYPAAIEDLTGAVIH